MKAKRSYQKVPTHTIVIDCIRVRIAWDNLPGQGCAVQSPTCSLAPSHFLPPLLGSGLVQSLFLTLVPGPQALEHVLQSDHALQAPSTRKIKRLNTSIFLNPEVTSGLI